jgi:hypothetical protein
MIIMLDIPMLLHTKYDHNVINVICSFTLIYLSVDIYNKIKKYRLHVGRLHFKTDLTCMVDD